MKYTIICKGELGQKHRTSNHPPKKYTPSVYMETLGPNRNQFICTKSETDFIISVMSLHELLLLFVDLFFPFNSVIIVVMFLHVLVVI